MRHVAAAAYPPAVRRSLDREIAALAVPAALSLATDPLYDLCDTAILGHVGTAELAGAALATRVLSFGYAAFVFLMFGTTAAVARHRGAGRRREATEQATTAVWIAAVVGVVAAGVLLAAGRPAIGLLGGRGAAAEHAWTYLSVSTAGIPAFTIVMAGAGFLRGCHDTRTPLWIAAAGVSFNLAAELVLVVGLGFGVGASALTTVVAKWLTATAYLVLVTRAARSEGARMRPARAAARAQLTVGRDLVLRTVLLLAVLTAAQAWVARIGVAELAAHAVAFGIWTFAALATDGLEVAAQALIAHRVGAGRADEVRRVVRRLGRWSLVVGVVLGGVIAATASVAPGLFTDDAAVASAASGILWWVAAMQPLNALTFMLDGVGVGAGLQRLQAASMALAASAFAATAVVLWRLVPDLADQLAGVWLALAAFMAARFVTGWATARRAGRV